ncbi:hypothetical protein [Sphingobacterium sp.]|uniref:hypothetical protein n=1 Tax=Sphingobacterium sp. TaxID=341027 RepID=UPI0031DFF4C0
MTEIKSLADRLRNELRSGGTENKPQEAKNKDSPSASGKKQKKLSSDELKADLFFDAILSFQVETTEKSLIRVDKKTMNLLKRIKLTKGVDMNRFIVYCVHQYIAQHPWLANYINETLKNTAL